MEGTEDIMDFINPNNIRQNSKDAREKKRDIPARNMKDNRKNNSGGGVGGSGGKGEGDDTDNDDIKAMHTHTEKRKRKHSEIEKPDAPQENDAKYMAKYEQLEQKYNELRENTNREIKKIHAKYNNIYDKIDMINESIEDLMQHVETEKENEIAAEADEDMGASASADADADANNNVQSLFEMLGLVEPSLTTIKKNAVEQMKAHIKQKKVKDVATLKANFYKYVDVLEKNAKDKTILEYFLNASNVEQNILIKNETELKNADLSIKIPTRLAILKMDIPPQLKHTIINKIQNSNDSKIKHWTTEFFRIPFGKYATLPVNAASSYDEINKYINIARESINGAIYGQEDAKEQLFQIIGKMITCPSKLGNVFAIYGPAGIGKTTLIKKSFCKTFNLPFSFISLGGAADSSYLRGHLYTYEGSAHGRIVSELQRCQVMNPVIYFDELDKVSTTSKGDEIINLLIHLTDPTQNSHFVDDYFADIPLDLSKAIFVFSFNNIKNVNPILLDRMNILKMDGYNNTDKMQIVKNYVLPALFEEYGVSGDDIIFTDDIIKHIITTADQTEGIRPIKNNIENIISKLSFIKMMSNGCPNKRVKLSHDNFKTITANNIEFPIHLTKMLVDKLVIKNKGKDNANFPFHMYS